MSQEKDQAAYADKLKKELEEAKTATAAAIAEAERARAAAAEAEAALKNAGGPAIIKGTYKGYAFVQGHARIRNAEGAYCDTQMLMDAANDKEHADHAAAVGELDRLIKINYAYFVKK